MKHIIAILAFIFSTGLGLPAMAESLHPFVVPAYYLPAGGSVLIDKSAIADPANYRSAEAYRFAKGRFERQLGHSLTDAAFAALVRSDQVELRLCGNHSIRSAALNNSGHPSHWTERDCAQDEYLAWLVIDGRGSVPVISMRCLNPLDVAVMPKAARATTERRTPRRPRDERRDEPPDAAGG